jgi:ribonuclease T2
MKKGYQRGTILKILFIVSVVSIVLYQDMNPKGGRKVVYAKQQTSSNFDFYVLVLSWSPDYCASDDNKDSQQCRPGRRLGFALHGLWPQYDKGYPSDCTTEIMSADMKAKFPGLYPNQALYDHEWERHGTCSGLTPEQYLSLSKKLKGSITIPKSYQVPEKPIRVSAKQFKNEFVMANPALHESDIAVYCSGSGRFLKEMFICFTRDGKPGSCSLEIQNKAARSCQNPDFLIRNIR